MVLIIIFPFSSGAKKHVDLSHIHLWDLALQLKTHEDAPALQDEDDEKHCSDTFFSDDTLLNMIANIPNFPTTSQQMLFEEAAALQIDCSELLNEEEEMRNSSV